MRYVGRPFGPRPVARGGSYPDRLPGGLPIPAPAPVAPPARRNRPRADIKPGPMSRHTRARNPRSRARNRPTGDRDEWPGSRPRPRRRCPMSSSRTRPASRAVRSVTRPVTYVPPRISTRVCEHGDRRTAGVASCRRPVAGHRSGPDHPALPECPPGADPAGPAAHRLPAGRPALRHHVDYRDPDHRVPVRTRAARSELGTTFGRDQGSRRRDDRRGAHPLRPLRAAPAHPRRREPKPVGIRAGRGPAAARPGSPCWSSSAWSGRHCSVIPTRCSGPSAISSGRERAPAGSTRPIRRSRPGSLRSRRRSTGI